MAETPRTLGAYIATLKRADIVALPLSEEWKEHVERISVPGRIAEVTEDDYDYWLDVLPPKWMHGGHFCFGEGADCFRFFWHDRATNGYRVRQLTWDETLLFCRLASLPTPS